VNLLLSVLEGHVASLADVGALFTRVALSLMLSQLIVDLWDVFDQLTSERAALRVVLAPQFQPKTLDQEISLTNLGQE